MKLSSIVLLSCTLLIVCGARCHAESKSTKKPAPPPSKSVKDLAIDEARKCDANHNGRIDGSEMMAVRDAWKSNPNSYLYLFDDNGNKYLDDSEISKIDLGTNRDKPAHAHKKTDEKKADPKKKKK
jgi:hypothetical protein